MLRLLHRTTMKIGTANCRTLRRRQPAHDVLWYLDKMFVSISERQMRLWRTVDAEGEVLDSPV